MITTDDLMWLAGWLEGEGSFGFNLHTLNKYRSLVLQASTTDKDIAEQAQKILGLRAKLYSWQPKGKPHYKLAWRLTLVGPHAAGWMMTLYALMGVRRKAQIKRALEAWKVLPQPPGKVRQVWSGARYVIVKTSN